jgi:hypothetical protein
MPTRPLSPPETCARLLLRAALGDSAELKNFLASADPFAISETATRHGLVNLAAHFLHQGNHTKNILDFDQLAECARRRAALQLLMLETMAELGEAFSRAGIRAAVTRGFSQAGRLYPPGCRVAGDIDLVIPPEYFPGAAELLAAKGFTPTRNPPDQPFARGKVTLDLSECPSALFTITHFPEEKTAFAELDRDWQHKLLQAEIPGLYEFPPALEFLASALHYAYKHRFVRHVWGLDLCYLLRELDGATVAQVAELARRGNAEHILARTLEHLSQIVGMPVGENLRQLLPARDPNLARSFLLRQCAARLTPPDTGYLLALACASNQWFRLKLLGKMLLPPSGDLRRRKIATGKITPRQRFRHYLSLPLRLKRAVFPQ